MGVGGVCVGAELPLQTSLGQLQISLVTTIVHPGGSGSVIIGQVAQEIGGRELVPLDGGVVVGGMAVGGTIVGGVMVGGVMVGGIITGGVMTTIVGFGGPDVVPPLPLVPLFPPAPPIVPVCPLPPVVGGVAVPLLPTPPLFPVFPFVPVPPVFPPTPPIPPPFPVVPADDEHQGFGSHILYPADISPFFGSSAPG